VKKLILSASSIACLAAMLSLGSTAWSEPGKGAPREASAEDNRPHKVGLIDMAYVFKKYKKFDALREDLKATIGDSEIEAKNMAEKIKQLQGEMKTMKEGTPDFDAKEKQLASLSAQFETFRRSTQRDILKEESKIYHTVYMEVADAVRKYSNHYKYTLVLRFNREDLNPEDPQGLIQGMNRQVVFHRPEDDMTDSVLAYLNGKFDEGAAPAKTQETKGPSKSIKK